jgi:hypothetical protein
MEASGLLMSHYEGNLRIYQFNPSYPLFPEVEALVKKAYQLLPSQEKKLYCFIHKPKVSTRQDLLQERE